MEAVLAVVVVAATAISSRIEAIENEDVSKEEKIKTNFGVKMMFGLVGAFERRPDIALLARQNTREIYFFKFQNNIRRTLCSN